MCEIKFQKSLLRLRRLHDGREDWYHLSVTSGAFKLRRFDSPTNVPDVERSSPRDTFSDVTRDYQLVDELQFSLGDAARKAGRKVPRYDDRDWWDIIQAIESRPLQPDLGAGTSLSLVNTGRLLEVTQLRRLYQLLRHVQVIGFHCAIAKGLLGDTQELIDVIDRSVATMEPYSNPEKFLPRPRDPLAFEVGDAIERGNDLIATLQSQTKPIQLDVQGYPNLNARFLEREVSPLRTTNGRWKSGAKATNSGAGGIDGLFCCTADNFPIVGEIKIKGDATPLLALVQALTYAVELSTPNQYTRLRSWLWKWYHCQIVEQNKSPQVDVYLILADYPHKKGRHDECLKLTDQIAKSLVDDAPRPRTPRRIVCLETSQSADGSLIFKKRFAYGQGIENPK